MPYMIIFKSNGLWHQSNCIKVDWDNIENKRKIGNPLIHDVEENPPDIEMCPICFEGLFKKEKVTKIINYNG